MDPVIVREKLESLRRCISRVEHKRPAPQSMEDVFKTLERLGVISAPTSVALRKAVGFRNIAVHSYDVINWAIVFAISEAHLEDFRRFAQEVSAKILDTDH